MAAMSSTLSTVIVMGRPALLEIARLTHAILPRELEHILTATAGEALRHSPCVDDDAGCGQFTR